METDNITELPPANIVQIPVVQYKDFQFPIRSVKDNDWATPENGVIAPESVIRELRAHCMALDDRITILLAALSLVKDEEVQGFLKAIGLTVVDVHRNPFPAKAEIAEPDTTPQN